MRPLPSSSMPLLQISGVVTEPVESVTVVEPSSPGYDSTISQYTPAGRAEKVWVVMAASPAETQVRGLRSQVSLAPARKSSTTCAVPVTCVKARRTSVVASISKRPTRPRPPLGAQVAYPLGAPTVSIMRVTLAPWIARVPKSVSGEQSTVRQPGKVVHIGSAQSTRPLPLSSIPLLQISVPGVVLQEMLFTHSGSAQSMRPSPLSSIPLLQISCPGLEQDGSPKQAGSAQSMRPLQSSSILLPQISRLPVGQVLPPPPPLPDLPPPPPLPARPPAPVAPPPPSCPALNPPPSVPTQVGSLGGQLGLLPPWALNRSVRPQAPAVVTAKASALRHPRLKSRPSFMGGVYAQAVRGRNPP